MDNKRGKKKYNVNDTHHLNMAAPSSRFLILSLCFTGADLSDTLMDRMVS